MRILGLDPSSQAIGVALVRDASIECWTVNLKDCKGDLRKVAVALEERLLSRVGMELDVVAIERPYVKFPHAAMVIGKVVGLLIMTFRECPIQAEYSIAQARKSVMGSGKADKEELMEFLRRAYYSVENEHEAAALACALAAKKELDILAEQAQRWR